MRAAFILAAVLAGCAAKPEPTWHKDGVTQETFYMENAQCQERAMSSPIPGGRTVAVYETCMQGKGYYLTQSP